MKKFSKKLRTSFKYSKRIALRFHDIRYYACMGEEYKNLLHKGLEQQKAKYSTPKSDVVTNIINKYKKLGKKKTLYVNASLRALSRKNISARFDAKAPPIHTNIHQFMSSVPLMIQSVRLVLLKNWDCQSKSLVVKEELVDKLA
jgi:hypothetical protein